MHDVAVVGGSLAGAAVAIHLARSGRRVVLLERAAAHRRKACGEGLFPRGVAELESLGVLDELRDSSGPLTGVRFHAGEAVAVARLGSREHCGLGIQRSVLDPLLLARAEAEGVEVRRGVSVTGLRIAGGHARGVSTSAGDVEACAVIAADGLHSRIRRQAGLDGGRIGSRYGVSAHVRLPAVPQPVVDVYFERGLELYVTPVGGHVANVALLLRRSAMRTFAGRLEEGYRELLTGHRAFPRGFELIDGPAAAGPFARGCRRAWRANVVLVGDAAGFFDGISGEGMSVALTSAREAAVAVDRYLDTGSYDHFRHHDAMRRAFVRNSNLLSRVSLTLGSRPRLARLAVRNLGGRPETFTKLVTINSGEAGFRSLRPSDFAAFFGV